MYSRGLEARPRRDLPLTRFVITAGLMVEAYTHNVRGRIPTDRLTQGLALVTGSTAGIGFRRVFYCERGVDVLALPEAQSRR